MRVNTQTVNRGTVVIASLHGELDHHAADGVREALDRELAKPGVRHMILDLKGVTFMDSSGLGVILGRYRKLKANQGELAIACVPAPVTKLFEISGMHKIMRLYKKRDDAIQAVEGVAK